MKANIEKDAIPDGWQRVRLGDMADVAFSGVDKRTVEGELPVQLCNYTDVFYNRRIAAGMALMNATATPSERDRWTLRMGDVLFTKDSETPDEIGIPALVADDLPGVLCGYHLGLARPRENIVDGGFLTEALTSSESRKEFARIANGVTRFGLTLDATKALPILLPPLPEQRAIASVLDSIDDAIEGAEAIIAATKALREALLHDLLTRGLPGQHTEFRDVPGLGTIPADWEVVRLGDVAEVAFSGVDKRTVDGELPVHLCNYTDVFYNRRIHTGMNLMGATATQSEWDRWTLREGDVLFTKDSETPEEIGIPAHVVGTIPADWEVVRLGDVAEVAFSGVDKRTVDGELPVHLCNYTDVFYNRRIHTGMNLMGATATQSEWDRWTLKEGDVLFTKDSETPEEIGIPAHVVNDMPGVLCGYHLGLARPRTDTVDGAFLAETLTSAESRKQFARIANGVTRFGLTLDAAKALPISLPPLREQQAIATTLEGVDAAVEVVRGEQEGLRSLKASTADALLTGRVRVGQ